LIERKLDRILEELRTPTAIGYSVRRGRPDRRFQKGAALCTPWLMGITKGGGIMNVEAE
jgi:hypothetical protein